jgi:hypothetical protein
LEGPLDSVNISFAKFLHLAKLPGRINFNSWVNYPGFTGLYLRYGPRVIDGKMVYPVLDIANVTAETKGKGTFKELIKTLRESYPELNIYVESVTNELFGDGLIRMGFVKLNNSTIPGISNNYFMPAVKGCASHNASL